MLRVLATEFMAACQAIDFREGLILGKGTEIADKYNVPVYLYED